MRGAYRLFSTKGYLATSIEDIAAEAGVARPTCARNMCRISARAGLVLRALEAAAASDADAAEVWARFQHQRRVGLNEFAVALAQKTSALRYEEDTITDTMWMLAPDAYLRLVHDAGWPAERFQAWLADLLQRMFLT